MKFATDRLEKTTRTPVAVTVPNSTFLANLRYDSEVVARFSVVSAFLLVLFLTAAGSALGQTAVAASDSPAAPAVCVPEPYSYLKDRLVFWQERLKVADWKITIMMSHPSDLKPKTLGNIHWDADKKTAVIRVLDASDYQLACPDMLSDMEFTVVHELVHLVLSSLPRSEASRGEEERAVNQLTDAMLKLYRHN